MTPFPPPDHPYMAWVILHIAAGCFAIVAGYVAVLAAKGGRLHRLAGKVFVASMLIGTSVAVYLAVQLLHALPGQMSNIGAGTLAFYLVLSAYVTVKRPDGTIGFFEKVSFLIPLALGTIFIAWGFEALNAPKHAFNGYWFPFYFVFGALSFFFAGLDVRVLIRGGLSGVDRIARHIWRMCFAFFFAAASFFIGQQKVMPPRLHGSPVLLALGLAPLGFLLFWMIRVRLGDRFKPAQKA